MLGVTMNGARDQLTAAAPDSAPPAVLVLLAAVAAGIVSQGGYYTPGRILLTVLVVVAGVIAAPGYPWRHPGPVPIAAAALAAWVLLRAALADWYPQALAEVATLACLVVAILLIRPVGPRARESTATALIWTGVAVGGTAWVGVAWRVPRFVVLVENRLWRGASTLTYPNAAAALLVPLALLALALLVARPAALSRAVAAYLLLAGAGATLSRAGALALLAGLVALAVLMGVRRVVVCALPVLAGAALATVALAPSFPLASVPRPGTAVLGLLAGALVAIGLAGTARLPGAVRVTAVAVLVLGAGLALVGPLRARYSDALLAARGTLDSSGRTGALHAALTMVAHRPLTGYGVGLSRFVWTTADGNGAIALYAHDEYLQTLVDLGAIGLALLAALIATIVLDLYRGRTLTHRPGVRAGAIAALVAFAVHSGFDFLWHIAVLPLVAGLLIGLAGPATRKDTGPATRKDTGPATRKNTRKDTGFDLESEGKQ